MKRRNSLEHENEALRNRLSRLSEASRRINESLEIDTVLQGVLDSARSLTGARYGVIILLENEGKIGKFHSSGMTPEEARRIWNTPDGMRIFEYLVSLSEPLRIPDLLARLNSVGLPEFSPPASVGSVLSFLAAPVLLVGERVGHIFVADKEAGAEFTPQDEETLVLFASQAALVISNARQYRNEQEARNDLETLINTSPVGVVVFDAHSGVPLSLNREAKRIVDGLRDPIQSPKDLLGVITIRRADGREIAIGELPLAQALRDAETVRAEKIVMRVPDGRSITTLVNATPIHSKEGKVKTFVVTLQDLSPFEELERQRSEFLAMVSQELRMPLTSIKGSVATVLDNTTSLEWSEIVQFFRIIDLQANRIQDLIGSLLEVARIESGTLSVVPKPTEVRSLIDEAKSAFISAGGRNVVEIDLPTDAAWVMADPGRIVKVLFNLLSSSSRHSPEGSSIRVCVVREEVHVAISIRVLGAEESAGLLPYMIRAYPDVEGGHLEGNTLGSGLALSVCKGIVEAHGGRLRAASNGPDPGKRFTLTLPYVHMGSNGSTIESTASPVRRRPGERERVRILAVDDDPQTLRYVHDSLSRGGFAPIVTGDPEDVPMLLSNQKPHLVLLDMLLPGINGFDLLNTILEKEDVPVIFLSEYGEEDVIAKAFDMGAADYVVKPFSATELSARIRAALRRGTAHGWSALPDPYRVGELSIDYAERQVTVAGRPVQLTATEYDVLYRLSKAAGRVLTHDQLLQWVWSPGRRGEPWLVRNVVKRLRRKIGDDAQDPAYIFTEPRVGYRMLKRDAPREQGN